jgi:hypothetical protein
MWKMILIFSISIVSLISCEKNCDCELVVYESTFEANYEWIEKSRESIDGCERDTLSSTYLDDDSNISYVRSIIECVN